MAFGKIEKHQQCGNWFKNEISADKFITVDQKYINRAKSICPSFCSIKMFKSIKINLVITKKIGECYFVFCQVVVILLSCQFSLSVVRLLFINLWLKCTYFLSSLLILPFTYFYYHHALKIFCEHLLAFH